METRCLKKDNVHANHRKRVRTRYIREGINNFEKHEVLELLLHYPMNYVDTNEIAHNLINEIGSFSGVLDAEVSDIIKVKGVGTRSAYFLKFMRSMIEYYIDEVGEDPKRTFSIKELAHFCIERCSYFNEEKYAVILFNVTNKLLGFEVLEDCSYHNPKSISRALGKHVFAYNAINFIVVRYTLDDNLIPSDKEIEACKAVFNFYNYFNRGLSEYFIIHGDKYMPVFWYASKHNKGRKSVQGQWI